MDSYKPSLRAFRCFMANSHSLIQGLSKTIPMPTYTFLGFPHDGRSRNREHLSTAKGNNFSALSFLDSPFFSFLATNPSLFGFLQSRRPQQSPNCGICLRVVSCPMYQCWTLFKIQILTPSNLRHQIILDWAQNWSFLKTSLTAFQSNRASQWQRASQW